MKYFILIFFFTSLIKYSLRAAKQEISTVSCVWCVAARRPEVLLLILLVWRTRPPRWQGMCTPAAPPLPAHNPPPETWRPSISQPPLRPASNYLVSSCTALLKVKQLWLSAFYLHFQISFIYFNRDWRVMTSKTQRSAFKVLSLTKWIICLDLLHVDFVYL